MARLISHREAGKSRQITLAAQLPRNTELRISGRETTADNLDDSRPGDSHPENSVIQQIDLLRPLKREKAKEKPKPDMNTKGGMSVRQRRCSFRDSRVAQLKSEN